MTVSEKEHFGSFDRGGIAAVFGASGGVGHALTKQLEASSAFDQVIGLSRQSQPSFDLLDEASIEAVASYLSGLGEIRLIIDATGFLHDDNQSPEKSLRELDADNLMRAFSLNAIGPSLIMKHLLPKLPREGKAVFATLSARVGSIGDNQLGGWYGYRASKAALNQLLRTASVEIRRRRPEVICVALHPGTVDTDLSSPFSKDGLNVQSADDAASRLISVIDGLGTKHHGGFFDHTGKKIAW